MWLHWRPCSNWDYDRDSNVCHWQKKRATAGRPLRTDELPPKQDDQFHKECRRNWARLVKKILEVDPLLCSRCGGITRIVSFIEDSSVMEKILLRVNPST